jgi:ParB/RepB/Spo0J family partition protein
MTAEKIIGKRSGEPVTKIRPKRPTSPVGPQPRADINGWVLCPGDAVLIIDPKGEHHGLFAKVDAFPTTLELSSYVQIDGRPSKSGRVLMPNAMLRWMGPDEAHIDMHRPTRPGERVRVVLDNEALATPEMKALEGKLGTVTELMPTAGSNSMVTVKLDDPAALPTNINSFDLLVVPIPVVHYVPEPEAAAPVSKAAALASVLVATQAPADDVQRANKPSYQPEHSPFEHVPESAPLATGQPADVKLSTKAWDALETIASIGGECWPKDFTTAQGKESIAELLAAGMLAGADGYYLLTGTGRAALPEADVTPAPAPVATEQPAEFRNIPLEHIAVTRNTRQVFDETALAELAQSIKERGVIAPITVRPNFNEGQPRYELVAGERRLRASKLAGLTEIPAMVRALDDRAFIEVQLLENLQRQDVRPSDEAQAFAELLNKHKFSPEEIALKVGKPVKFVLQRAKLTALVPFWMKLLEKEQLPLAAAHHLARLPAEGQELVRKYLEQNYAHQLKQGTLSTNVVEGAINQQVLRNLDKAAFPKDDATLHAPAGACLACPKRSGAHLSLFADQASDGDQCLDAGCFATKRGLFVERRITEITKQDGQAPVLISNDSATQKKRGAVASWNFTRMKQGSAGAVRAIYLDGSEAGQEGWGKPSSGAGSRVLTEQEKAEQAARLRADRVQKQHRLAIAEKLTFDLEAAVDALPARAVLQFLIEDELSGQAKDKLAYLKQAWGWELPAGKETNTYGDREANGERPYTNYLRRYLDAYDQAQLLRLHLSLAARHKMNDEYSQRQFTIAKIVGSRYDELLPAAEQAVEERYYSKKGAKK